VPFTVHFCHKNAPLYGGEKMRLIFCEKCTQNFDRRPEEKRPDGRIRRPREVLFQIDLEAIGYDAVDWIHLAQDRDR
jgi:hypothetical protein